MSAIRTCIERGIELHGSQAKLAKAAGCSQQYISLLLSGDGRISAEMAIAFEKATGTPRHKLRPDVFGKPERAA